MRAPVPAPVPVLVRVLARVPVLVLVLGAVACSTGRDAPSGEPAGPATTGSGPKAARTVGSVAPVVPPSPATPPDASPAPPIAPPAVVAAPPLPTTCALGPPVVLATAARTPGPIEVAIEGDRTAVAWTDGGKTYAIVVDATGAPVAPAALLTAAGFIKALHLLVAPAGFVVVTIEGDRCELRARTLDGAGHLEPSDPLIRDVCNPFGYPQVAIRDGLVLAIVAHGYEAYGLDALHWRPGGAAELSELVPRTRATTPGALVATATGFAAAWLEGQQPGDLTAIRIARLDGDGNPQAPARFASPEGATVAWLGATPVALRVRRSSLELRAGKAWNRLGPAKEDDGPRLITLAGRTWALPSALGDGPTLVIPVGDDGSSAGAGFSAPSHALAHDGHRGVVASWRQKPRELLLQPMTCTR